MRFGDFKATEDTNPAYTQEKIDRNPPEFARLLGAGRVDGLVRSDRAQVGQLVEIWRPEVAEVPTSQGRQESGFSIGAFSPLDYSVPVTPRELRRCKSSSSGGSVVPCECLRRAVDR